VIRIEVTSEADVTRMVAAFQVLPVLAGSDYEIWLVSGSARHGTRARMRRAWRLSGQRGGTWPSDWPEPASGS
jgi:hypothetical protein